MRRGVRREAHIAFVSGVLLLGLALAWCAPASATEPPPRTPVLSLQERVTAATGAMARLQRRADLRGDTPGLRRLLRAVDRRVLVLNRSAVALNQAALSGDPAGSVVQDLIALDRSILTLDTRAARLTLRLGFAGRRAIAARILNLRQRVRRCRAALKSLRVPAPTPTVAPTTDPTPAPEPTAAPSPAPEPPPAGILPFPVAALPGDSLVTLPDRYETSGLAWHPRLEKLLAVSDGGVLTSLRSDGGEAAHLSVPGDLEGICVADPQSDFVYVGVEHPDGILEVDLDSGVVVRRFDLTRWLTGPDNRGLEALAFVPDEDRPEGGVFYAGLQDDGRVYIFELPIVTSTTSTSVTYLGAITLEVGLADLADLSYDRDSGVLLAVFDGPNRLKATTSSGRLLREWDLPGTEQEGVCRLGDALFVGEDYGGSSAGRIIRYAPFALH